MLRPVRLQIPAAWKIRSRGKTQPITEKSEARSVVINVELVVPGCKNLVRLEAAVRNGVLRNPMCEAWWLSTGWAREKSLEVNEEPQPHLRAVFDGDLLVLTTVRNVRGRGIEVTQNCIEKEWPKVRDAFFDVSQSIRSKVAAWPSAAPKGRVISKHQGVWLSVGKGVRSKDVKALSRLVKTLRKDYEKHHAPLPWTDAEPMTIFLNATDEGHAELNAGRPAPIIATIPRARRMFAVPIGARGSELRKSFLNSFYCMMLAEQYPEPGTCWMLCGELVVARMQDEYRRPLPWMCDALFPDGPAAVPFEDVLPVPGYTRFVREAEAYQLLFRCGPKKYVQAYDAYLRDLRQNVDPRKAKERHLLSLDQEQMRKDLRTLFKKKLRRVRLPKKK